MKHVIEDLALQFRDIRARLNSVRTAGYERLADRLEAMTRDTLNRLDRMQGWIGDAEDSHAFGESLEDFYATLDRTSCE